MACGGCYSYIKLPARCLPPARTRPPALPVVLTRSFILYCGRLLVLSSSRPPCRRRRFRYCCDVISPPKLYYRNTARASTVSRISVLGSSVVAQYQINGIRRRLQLLASTSPPPTQVLPRQFPLFVGVIYPSDAVRPLSLVEAVTLRRVWRVLIRIRTREGL